jgi:hypothetical protein
MGNMLRYWISLHRVNKVRGFLCKLQKMIKNSGDYVNKVCFSKKWIIQVIEKV